MSIQIGPSIFNLLDPIFYMSIAAVIVGGLLLLTKRKQLDKYIRTIIISLTLVSLITALSLSALAIAFGNSHPSALPLPVS